MIYVNYLFRIILERKLLYNGHANGILSINIVCLIDIFYLYIILFNIYIIVLIIII